MYNPRIDKLKTEIEFVRKDIDYLYRCKKYWLASRAEEYLEELQNELAEIEGKDEQ